jgi:hypothetical protein
VRADGTLVAGEVTGSIHQVGAALEGAPSCNGWTYWHFRRDGQTVPIDVLRQQIRAEMTFDASDTEQKVVDTRDGFAPSDVSGVEVVTLHDVPGETVTLQRWEPGAKMPAVRHDAGQEVFVLEGTWEDEHGRYPAGTWLRNPPGFAQAGRSEGGCLLYVKTGHLAAVSDAA